MFPGKRGLLGSHQPDWPPIIWSVRGFDWAAIRLPNAVASQIWRAYGLAFGQLMLQPYPGFVSTIGLVGSARRRHCGQVRAGNVSGAFVSLQG